MRIGLVGMVVLFAVIVACSGKAHKIEQVAVSVNPSDNPTEQLESLGQEFREARAQNVPLLAPTWFDQAHHSFSEAQEFRDSTTNLEKTFKKIAEARVELMKACQIAKISQKELADVLDARDSAMKSRDSALAAGAVDLKALKDELSHADQEFVQLSEAVEQDDLVRVTQNKNEVIKRYLRVVTDGLKKENLDVARRTIDEARKQGAKRFAPESLDFAETTLKRAVKFVSENPWNKAEIQQLGTEATFYANQALKVTLEAKKVVEKQPEQVALEMESTLSGLAQEAGGPENRQRSLSEQVKALKSSIRGLRSQAAEADALSVEVEMNQNAAEMNERVAQVQKLFTSEEAEVLREGSKVIIRLKDLKFPVGEASLKKRNFPLMAKVQRALSFFDGNLVRVEGHTDETGSEMVNLPLSQKRAEAVKIFLVTNKAVDEAAISVMGHGFNRPIASNKTKSGRAQNRRIDLVISAPSLSKEPKFAE